MSNPWDDTDPFELFYKASGLNDKENDNNNDDNIIINNNNNNIEYVDEFVSKLKLADHAAKRQRERRVIEQKRKIYSEMESILTDTSIDNIIKDIKKVTQSFKDIANTKKIQKLAETMIKSKRQRYVTIGKNSKDRIISITKFAQQICNAITSQESNNNNDNNNNKTGSFDSTMNNLINAMNQIIDEFHDMEQTIMFMKSSTKV